MRASLRGLVYIEGFYELNCTMRRLKWFEDLSLLKTETLIVGCGIEIIICDLCLLVLLDSFSEVLNY